MGLFSGDNPFTSIGRRVGRSIDKRAGGSGLLEDVGEAAAGLLNLAPAATYEFINRHPLMNMFNRGQGIGGQIRAQDRRRSASLLAATNASEEIDKESQAEIRSLLGTGNIARAERIFKEARAGTMPKYKSRQVAQKYYETLVDQPGSRQTRESGVASLLMGNQFTGRGA